MQVQIVRASTRHKVLNEARRILGPDPLVLAVRRQPKEGGEDHEWEAVVARETPVAEPASPSRGSGTPQAVADLRRELIAARQRAGGNGGLEMLDLARRLSQLESEVLTGLLEGRSLPESWLPLIERLDASGYPKGDALRLVQRVEATMTPAPGQDLRRAFHGIREALRTMVNIAPVEERVSPGLVIFCGGSGVGKTTMAAKLAADLCLGGMRRPLLGVVLPRRGVGVETLRRCARTLGIEFIEVLDGEGLNQMEERARSQPVILDSISVSPRDQAGLDTLKQTFAEAPTAEVHAVIPATHGAQDFDTALSAFGYVGANRLSITHLDDAPYVGRFLAAAGRARIPIAYISQGPRIPDDLIRPSMDALLNAVLSTEVVASL